MADATMRRMPRAFTSSCSNTNQPFIVPITSVATLVTWQQQKKRGIGPNVCPALEPARTITTAARHCRLQHDPGQIPWPTAGQRLDETIARITSGGNLRTTCRRSFMPMA